VKVGHDEGASGRPEDGALRQETELFAGEVERMSVISRYRCGSRRPPAAEAVVSAAFSGSAAGLRIRSASFRGELLPGPVHQQRKGERRGALDLYPVTVPAVTRSRARANQLCSSCRSSTSMGLEQRRFSRIVAGEDIVEQLARRLELLHRLVHRDIPGR
jgi:hypothetical protein